MVSDEGSTCSFFFFSPLIYIIFYSLRSFLDGLHIQMQKARTPIFHEWYMISLPFRRLVILCNDMYSHKLTYLSCSRLHQPTITRGKFHNHRKLIILRTSFVFWKGRRTPKHTGLRIFSLQNEKHERESHVHNSNVKNMIHDRKNRHM